VPITPRIVTQIRDGSKDRLLSEIRYFSSVNIAFAYKQPESAGIDMETQRVPRVRRPPRSARRQYLWVWEIPPSLTYQGVGILTFRNDGSSLNRGRISSTESGYLQNLSSQGDVFEIFYPTRNIALGYVLNKENNRYELEFALEATSKTRIPLVIAGERPFLMINYRTIFSGGETHIQLGGEISSAPVPLPTEEDRPVPEPDNVAAAPPPEIQESRSGNGEAEESSDSRTGRVIGTQQSRPRENARIAAPKPELYYDSGSPPQETPLAAARSGGYSTGSEYRLEEAPPTDWGDEYNNGVEFLPAAVQGGGPDLLPKDGLPVVVWGNAGSPDFREEKTAKMGAAKESLLLMDFFADSDIPFVVPRLEKNCTIQVGAFREGRNANLVFKTLKQAGFCPLYETGQNLTRVIVPAVEIKNLPRVKERIKSLGFNDLFIRY
jgi:hypothetical protein